MALRIRVHEHVNEAFSPKTVKIGNHVWMAENLNVDDGGKGIYHNPENNEYYYTWDAAMRVAKSILGWHLPTAIEWNEAALACGAIEVPYKDGSNPNYNDYDDAQELKDKLDVKLAGYYNGSFHSVGYDTYFWTSTECSSTSAYHRYFNTNTSMDSDDDSKYYGSSVRLVKD